MDDIQFLGHQVCKGGLKPGKGKVEAVLGFPTPQDASKVRSFLGLINYMGRFIPTLSELSEPLKKLTCKGAKFKFGKKETQAFSQLKQALASHPTLGFFDVNSPTQVIADASPIGLGAVPV